LGLLLTVGLLIAGPASASEWHFQGVDRVVALSDIHGAYEPMVRTLQNAGVITEDLAWAAGRTHLVIVGDILDRGPNSREAMDLLMALEGEAQAVGGMVHVLIGNHEAMNLLADLRYVAKGEYAAFAAEELPEERERWYAEFLQQRAPAGKTDEELRELFDGSFPDGYFAHRRAFSTGGKYGRWLLEKPIMIVINETAYVHGGVSPLVAELGLDGINGKLRKEMIQYVDEMERLYETGALLPTDNYFEHPQLLSDYLPPVDTQQAVLDAMDVIKELNGTGVYGLSGPLWYRGNVACNKLIELDRLALSLDAVGAKRVVIGHTPTGNRRVLERFDGRVVEVDTGMLNSYYRGSGNALVIEAGELSVVGEGGQERAAPAQHPRRVGQRPAGFMTARDIELLLAEGEIADSTVDEAGNRIVTVSDGETTIEGVFAERPSKGFYPEVAAYRLDLLLELDMVPVTVRREIGRDQGSLQYLAPGSIDEKRRHEKGYGGSAMCPLTDQWDAMFVFDALIYNDGRFLQTIKYSPDSWQLLLVGHGRSFPTRKGRPKHLEGRDLALGKTWRDTLASMTDEVLGSQLADVLDKKRLSALSKRRDELLAQP
jgi:hypothetical protein